MSSNQTDNFFVSYQMGKVGSSSITAKISGCVQIHSWNGEEPIKYFSSRYTGSVIGRILQNLKWRYVSASLERNVKKVKKAGGTIKYIVGVREPVSRSVSGYFQTLTAREEGKDIDQIIDEYWACCSHFAPLYWFDLEIRENLGVDVYEYPFDKEKGCCHIVNGQDEIFIYQLEKLSSLKESIRSFVDDDAFELVRANDAADKWLGNVYTEFTKQFKPGSEYLGLMYGSKYFNHFYSEEDKKRFLGKWN